MSGYRTVYTTVSQMGGVGRIQLGEDMPEYFEVGITTAVDIIPRISDYASDLHKRDFLDVHKANIVEIDEENPIIDNALFLNQDDNNKDDDIPILID